MVRVASVVFLKSPCLREYPLAVYLGTALGAREVESPKGTEFFRLPNLFCTPYIVGNAEEGVLEMGRAAIDCLERYFGQ